MKATVQIAAAALALCLAGCKTRYVSVPEYHFRDSTKMVYQRDSVFLHDSVFVNQYVRGDTVVKEVRRTKVVYRDRRSHDTVRVERRDTVSVAMPVEGGGGKLPWGSRAALWVALIAAVGAAAMWLLKWGR